MLRLVYINPDTDRVQVEVETLDMGSQTLIELDDLL